MGIREPSEADDRSNEVLNTHNTSKGHLAACPSPAHPFILLVELALVHKSLGRDVRRDRELFRH
jgi:hypothetical protein